ncbi:hypothetical protein DL771_009377 [Monosporascus sp. 5C6A]|nr:hypothetical protein DL771_009377 [Monosporascus sp. 5C6A]
MPERAVPCCRCLAALAAWRDGAAPLCCDCNSAVAKKCRSCRDLGKPCIAPSGLLKARAIALRAAIAAHPGVRPAAVKEAQAAGRSAAAAEKTAAAVGKIALELQRLRGEVAGQAEVYRKTHEASVEAAEKWRQRRSGILRTGNTES